MMGAIWDRRLRVQQLGKGPSMELLGENLASKAWLLHRAMRETASLRATHGRQMSYPPGGSSRPRGA